MTRPGRRARILAALSGTVLHVCVCAYAEDVVYPPRAGHFDVREFGARGDGRTDDTEAFRKAIQAVKMHFQVIYLPNGTYLVSDTISWGAWITLQGQSRSGTVIRLKDRCPGFSGGGKPVIRCMFNNNMSFSNYIRNLTVDTGKGNAGAIGVRYNAHNHGVLEEVTIRSGDGAGKIGLDMAETEFGPGMVRNVTIEGFDVGIKTPGLPSNAVFEHITLRNQNVVGFENSLPVSVRGLVSVNRVPAVRNTAHALAQLVLIDADLRGGAAGASAIENRSRCYLRNIRSSGYSSALKGAAGNSIAERVVGQVHSVFPSEKAHLSLPIEDPPSFDEPVRAWARPSASASALQKAIDSGARTVFLPSNAQVHVSDTIHVRGNVRRLVALKHHHGNLRASNPDAFRDRPVLRIEGRGTEPVIIESVGVSTWPKTEYEVIEIATSRPVYLKYVWARTVTTAPGTKGDLFIDEAMYDLRIGPGWHVWIRQCNIENNPFDPARPKLPRTYIVNRGADVWILGYKTESPAVHAVTLEGGRTEVLGGFFRDHFGPDEYRWQGDSPLAGVDMQRGVPYFITKDAHLSASYLQYAWGPGKARDLQAVEIRGAGVKELRVGAGTARVDLYSAFPPGLRRKAGASRSPAARERTRTEKKAQRPAKRPPEVKLWRPPGEKRDRTAQPEAKREAAEDPEATRLFKRAESLFIDGEFEGAAKILRRLIEKYPGSASAAKAREYLDVVK